MRIYFNLKTEIPCTAGKTKREINNERRRKHSINQGHKYVQEQEEKSSY